MKAAPFLSFPLAAFAVLALPAPAMEITLPVETARLRESPLPGYTLALALCQTCHSADYVQTQPVSSRAWWKSNVTKMQKTFGAPIPEEAVEPLVDYLVKTYGTERSGSLSSAGGASTPPAAGAAVPAASRK
jgi:hypothetical protein